jgi:hypothetical protein
MDELRTHVELLRLVTVLCTAKSLRGSRASVTAAESARSRCRFVTAGEDGGDQGGSGRRESA